MFWIYLFPLAYFASESLFKSLDGRVWVYTAAPMCGSKDTMVYSGFIEVSRGRWWYFIYHKKRSGESFNFFKPEKYDLLVYLTGGPGSAGTSMSFVYGPCVSNFNSTDFEYNEHALNDLADTIYIDYFDESGYSFIHADYYNVHRDSSNEESAVSIYTFLCILLETIGRQPDHLYIMGASHAGMVIPPLLSLTKNIKSNFVSTPAKFLHGNRNVAVCNLHVDAVYLDSPFLSFSEEITTSIEQVDKKISHIEAQILIDEDELNKFDERKRSLVECQGLVNLWTSKARIYDRSSVGIFYTRYTDTEREATLIDCMLLSRDHLSSESSNSDAGDMNQFFQSIQNILNMNHPNRYILSSGSINSLWLYSWLSDNSDYWKSYLSNGGKMFITCGSKDTRVKCESTFRYLTEKLRLSFVVTDYFDGSHAVSSSGVDFIVYKNHGHCDFTVEMIVDHLRKIME